MAAFRCLSLSVPVTGLKYGGRAVQFSYRSCSFVTAVKLKFQEGFINHIDSITEHGLPPCENFSFHDYQWYLVPVLFRSHFNSTELAGLLFSFKPRGRDLKTKFKGTRRPSE